MNIQRYSAADLPTLFDKISKNSIGMDEYFDSFWNQTTTNYPPYNLIHESNVLSRLEIALAGFKRDEVKVYTEYGKLYVTAEIEDKKEEGEFMHRGLAKRSFTRMWQMSEDVEIKHVDFDNGLLNVLLGKIVPEHHARKDYL